MNTLVGKRLKYPYDNMMGLGMMGGVPKITLQQNMLDSVVLIEDFEKVSDWSSTGGSSANDTTNYISGAQSIRQISLSGVAANVIKKVVSLDLNKYFHSWFYVYPNSVPSTTILEVDISLCQNSAEAIRFDCFSPSVGWAQSSWNKISLTRYLSIANSIAKKWNPASTANWANPITKIISNAYGKSGQVADVSVDGLYFGDAKPAVMIGFDDARDSMFIPGFQYMKTRRIRGTQFSITSRIGTSTFMTANQLQQMDAAGWSIGNHTRDHIDLSTLSLAQQEAELSNGKSDLDALGLTKASMHVAYPYGGNNADTLTAMSNTGMLSGRVVGSGIEQEQMFIPYILNWNLLTGAQVTQGMTLDQVKTIITNAVTNHQIIQLLFHQLEEITTTEASWQIANFQALIDWLIAQKIVCLTINDLYSLRTGAITIPRSW